MSKSPASLLPAMYSHRIHDIQAIARLCGYAIAVHGSMSRDLDLVAIPWVKKATTAETLIRNLCKHLGVTVGTGQQPTEKPHGRKAWSLHCMGNGYLDISVMPRLTK